MKKVALVLVLAMVALAIVGAQGNDWFFVSRTEGGTAAKDNTISLRRGKNYVYIYFKNGMPGADFDTVTVDFTLDKPLEVVWQAGYVAPNETWGSEEKIGTIDKGPITTDCATFKTAWSGNSSRFSKVKMNGLCLQVTVPSGTASFTLKEVSFAGLKK